MSEPIITLRDICEGLREYHKRHAGSGPHSFSLFAVGKTWKEAIEEAIANAESALRRAREAEGRK